MPNIEIYGLPKLSPQTARVMSDISRSLSGAPYRNEVVITQVDSAVFDLKGDSHPYLRIIAPATSGKEIKDIEDRLKGLLMDMEVLLLGHFTPKENEINRPDKFWPTKHP